jgi:hypothetical protein
MIDDNGGFKHARFTGQDMRDHWEPIVSRIAYEISDPRDATIEAQAVEIEHLRTALTQIRDLDVERSSEAWKRHSVKLKLIASTALGDKND